MSDSTRELCEGLLRAMGHNTPDDVSRKHTRLASRFRACFHPNPSLDAFGLARRLDQASGTWDEARDVRGELVGLARYPLKPLSWSWADVGKGPGQLDMSRSRGPTTAVGAIADWLAGRSDSVLVLSGGAGCGKTVAAVRLAIGSGGKFIEAARFDEMDFADQTTMNILVRSGLLIIDDLGRESRHGKTPTRVTEVIRSRHDNGMPTIITTQLTGSDSDDKETAFSKRYGQHLLDRVQRDGSWVDLELDTRRGSGARPDLTTLLRSCRIAHLHDKLMASGTSVAVVHELRDLLGIDQSAIAAGMAERAEELRMLNEQMAQLQDSIHAEIVRRIIGAEVVQ